MNQFQIRFQGFSPSAFTENYLRQILERIQHEAPASSFIKATFSRSKEAFKGIIHVRSQAGSFFAIASDRHMTEVGHQVVARLHKQLEKWKQQRRSRETIRHPEMNDAATEEQLDEKAAGA